MEILLSILVGLLALALIAGRIRRQTARFGRRSVNKRVSNYQAPFDRDSARHVAQDYVLSGSAYVVDGDTLVLQKTQVRLFGIDAPELDHPYGQKAKWALVKLCKGNTVRAEVTDKDDHGRTVARCFLQDGRDLSAEMVKIGLAID